MIQNRIPRLRKYPNPSALNGPGSVLFMLFFLGWRCVRQLWNISRDPTDPAALGLHSHQGSNTCLHGHVCGLLGVLDISWYLGANIKNLFLFFFHFPPLLPLLLYFCFLFYPYFFFMENTYISHDANKCETRSKCKGSPPLQGYFFWSS